MKAITENITLGILLLIIGTAIIVGGILTMALYHDMSWQSYVIIGVIMLCALWAMIGICSSLINTRRNRRR